MQPKDQKDRIRLLKFYEEDLKDIETKYKSDVNLIQGERNELLALDGCNHTNLDGSDATYIAETKTLMLTHEEFRTILVIKCKYCNLLHENYKNE